MGHLRSLLASAPRCAGLLLSQRWPRARIEAYQADRLRAVLAAARRIAFYAERLPPGATDLETLPILERLDVPQLTASVRAALPPNTRPLAACSSGSTGMPREFLFDEEHQRGRFAARLRYLLSSGWNPLVRSAWAIFLPEGTPDGRLIRNPLLLNTHFFSALDDVARQVEWLRYIDPQVLYTLPSNLALLLDRIGSVEDTLPSLRRVLTGGEVVEDALRERTRERFGLEIQDNYGSTEACLAWQCSEGSYHVNAEHVAIEVVDDEGRPVPPGELGRVLVTTLENQLCPLVRYAIGDHAEAADGPCPCGRTLPVLGRVVGRAINLFRLEGGRVVSPWGLVVRTRAHHDVDQFQIVQTATRDFVLRHVTPQALSEATRRALVEAFRDELRADVRLTFERVESIPRSPTGKFMTALSEVTA